MAIPALFFAIGIASGRYGPTLTALHVYAVLVIAFILNIHLLKNRPHSFLKPLSIALVFFVIGNVNVTRIKPPQLNNQLKIITSTGQDVVLTGILRTAPSFNGDKGKFIVDVDSLKADAETTISIHNRILLKTTFPPPTNLAPGDRILARASLSIPSAPGTPGSFNYRQYLADRHIHITGFIRSPAYLSSLGAAPPPDSLMDPKTHLPEYLRYKTNLFIDSTNLSLKIKALYKAIITGQRDSIPLEIMNNFKRSGAIHLLAISGMHMALLALLSGLMINYLLRKSTWLLLRWPAWKIATILTLMIMGCYATISGLQPPVVRAFIMASTLIVAIILDRPKSLLNAMALAALLILFYEPTALFSVSFQLSFVAVSGIILFSDQFSELFRFNQSQQTPFSRFKLWLGTGITISVVALLATAPITLYHFRQVSLIGPLTTILTAPLICFWALPWGLIASLLSPWLPNAATAMLNIGSAGLSGADLITSTLAAIPFSFHILPPPAIINIAVYYLIAAYLLFFKSRLMIKVAATITMIIIMSIPTNSFSRSKNNDHTRITFIDVGQGNSTLLELPNNKNILVDGGGSSSPRFNPGEQIIGPFLWHQSIRHLDALVISHPHQDHYNGLEFIIRNFKPAEVWINGTERKSEGYRDILRAAAETGAKIRIPGKGTVIATSGAAQLTSISNLHLRNDPNLSLNSRSLVIRLEVNGKKIILPGDIMADDGQSLVDQDIDLQSDILLAPHHGSKYSAGYHLMKENTPKWLIVSASPFKSEHFPDPDFAEWSQKRGTNILNTAQNGAITFTINENGKIIRDYRKAAKSQ